MPEATSSLQPFTPHTPPAVWEDLRARLRATRWPDGPEGAGWSLGADVAELRELVRHWSEDFDWPAQEAALARHRRVQVDLGGVRVVTVHQRATPAPDGAPALPLVLCHGWPDSSWRYSRVIDLLTDPGSHGGDPADAFDVVVPDMPGFGWSPVPGGAPLDSVAVAGLWARLMTALGHERFAAAGGDIGSHVARYLALDHPDRVVAVHRTDAGLPPASLDPAELTEAERTWQAEAAAWAAGEGAYAAVHRTKPQTAAVALNDSPAGLAAWIVEKLRAWSDTRGAASLPYTADEVCTLLTQYWVTGTIGSSMRMYAANAAIAPDQLVRRVEVPSAFSLFPADIVPPPREWLERSSNLVRLGAPARGGHFAPFEVPELYVQELRESFRPYRPAAR